MAVLGVGFQVEGLDAVHALRSALAVTDEVTAKEKLTKRINEATPALVSALQSAAAAIPASHNIARRDGQSLRSALSAAIKVERTKDGARVFVDSARMPEGSKQMGFAFDKPGGWRHPVFGLASSVQQDGHPWFHPTVNGHRRDFDAAGEAAIDDIAQSLGLRR